MLSRSNALDATWAYGRRSCVEAVTRIVDSVGIELLGDVAELLDWFVIKFRSYKFS